jgi:pimeloyl-ACP methyl ester carboxylesterase
MPPLLIKESFTPHPSFSYAESLERIDAVSAREAEIATLGQVCGSKLETHGTKTGTVIVFLHGFTSCPEQFRYLGERFFEREWNVYIPRLPRHGLTDLTGDPLKGLTAEALAQFGMETTDIAQGLGQRVIVAGLSGGGSIATWLSSDRTDIDLAVPISPFLGIGFIPRRLTRLLARLAMVIPDSHMWWDPSTRMDNPLSSPYTYRGYWTHALFEVLRLGFTARAAAQEKRPSAGSILVISNASDTSVNNGVIADYERIWSRYGDGFLRSYQFPRSDDIPHDMITFTRPDARPEVVYPRLLELIQ